MSGAAGRGRRTRRTRLLILAAAAALAGAATAAFLLRPRPAPYTPGTDAGAGDEITRALARSLPKGFPGVQFVDAAPEAGIAFRHFDGARSTQLPEDMGSGLAWGDYDNDGDPDLFLVNEDGPLTRTAQEAARSPARAALYRNDGSGRFTDVTAAAGLEVRGCGMGAAWGDYDGDGDLDLVVTRFGTNLLYRNNGDGTFTDVSAATGVGAETGFWTGASWGDYDRDGDLDLYVAGYVRYRYDAALAGKSSQQYRAAVPFTLNPSSYPPERNLLLRNEGGRFRDVARQAGVDNLSGRSLSAAWSDLDGDGWPDLYVANDISDNALFHNLGNGRFADESTAAWVADYRGAMGLGIGDWDNDGDLDIFIAHWIAQENALYDNQRPRAPSTGNGAPPAHGAPPAPLRFLDIADQVGLGQIALDFVGWGAEFFDYDNDGRLDIFVADGSTFQRDDDPSRLVPMRNLLFWNAGPRDGFFDAGGAAGKAMLVENVGRGAAAADYDGDGDLDLAVAVNGGALRLLRNDGGDRRHWLRVVLRGPAPARRDDPHRDAPRGAAPHRTTTFATGAVVRLVAGDTTQMREIGSGPSYLSQSPPGETHFGVGDAATVERLEIDWPSGARQVFGPFPADATVTLTEGGVPTVSTPAAARANAPDAAPSAAPPADRDAVRLFWRTFGEATALRIAGNCDGAVDVYRRALVLNPQHEDTLYYLGQCLQAGGQVDEARRAFEALVAANPESARGHLALGALALARAGGPDLAEAEARFARAHAINKEESGAMLHLGEIAVVRDDATQARRWLQAARRINPRSVEAILLLGYLDWQAGDRQAAAARCAEAAGAAVVPAPVQGASSEGDRRKSAPPLTEPMGKTLFSDAGEKVRRAAAAGAASRDVCDPGAIYPAVGDLAKRLRLAALAQRSAADRRGPEPER